MKRNLTYRTRKRLKTTGIILGCILVLSFVIWLCWVIWLGRFVVYSRDDARLDFEWTVSGQPVAAVEPTDPTVNILYDDGTEEIVKKKKDLEKLSGCYVTAEMLRTDVAEVDRCLREQPKGSAVMIELKVGSGKFYYDSALPDASVTSQTDTKAVGDLISYVTKADYYAVACVSALRDRAYGLDHTTYGIHHSSGGYLWAGSDKCYWLDPAKNGTRLWLMDIAMELRDLGFDEVVFLDFCFPPTQDILYEGDKVAALNETAQDLVYNLATDTFCVSFVCNQEGFLLPEGRTRLYRDDVDASMIQSVAAGLDLPSSEINLVCLTEAKDTRFDAFGVLRPLPVNMPDLTEGLDSTTQTSGIVTVEPEEPAEPQEPEAPAEPAEG